MVVGFWLAIDNNLYSLIGQLARAMQDVANRLMAQGYSFEVAFLMIVGMCAVGLFFMASVIKFLGK